MSVDYISFYELLHRKLYGKEGFNVSAYFSTLKENKKKVYHLLQNIITLKCKKGEAAIFRDLFYLFS